MRPGKLEPLAHIGQEALIGELDLEAGEIDLGLLAGRGLEPHFEWRDRIRA